MSSSCPYCGAVIKLKFCVVCGRHGQLNKMGHLRTAPRNTDITQRLEGPLDTEIISPQKSLRFHRNVRPIIEAILGGLISGTLILFAAKQGLNFYGSENINDVMSPWIKNHHLNFPNNWDLQAIPIKDAHTMEKTGQHRKKVQKNRNKNLKNKVKEVAY